jgi:hypothetical protein
MRKDFDLLIEQNLEKRTFNHYLKKLEEKKNNTLMCNGTPIVIWW